MKKILKGPNGLEVELDSNEIYPNDPGQGTPALVVFPNGNTGTFNCVLSEGENVEGDKINDSQRIWLESIEKQVDDFISQK